MMELAAATVFVFATLCVTDTHNVCLSPPQQYEFTIQGYMSTEDCNNHGPDAVQTWFASIKSFASNVALVPYGGGQNWRCGAS
jgi:hypothetical protein